MGLSAEQVFQVFEGLRRAQNNGLYAPHKPLLVLLALARIQQGEPRLSSFQAVEPKLKALLIEFGPTGAEKRRHLPFWHLASDHRGQFWNLLGPDSLTQRPSGQTPTLGALRGPDVQAGFTEAIDTALREDPGLLGQVAQRVLNAYFPKTLHEDIAAEVGLNLLPMPRTLEPAPETMDRGLPTRRRDPAFRQKVLMAYEYRCCVCGFDLRVGHMPAGLEAAHIQWHTVGGPDVVPNGLCLCSLHHKLFDLGAFTIEPSDFRVVFSRHAIAGSRGHTGELATHGRRMLMPQTKQDGPGAEYLAWNLKNVFKTPARI